MSKFSLKTLILFVFVIGFNQGFSQNAVYDFFSTNGLAGPTNSPPCNQITASDPGSAGSAWINYALTNNPAYVINLGVGNTSVFDQTFQMTFGPNNWGGADGLAFVIADTASSKLGSPGKGVGYGQGNTCGPGLGNCFIDNSIAFEIDTHPNSGTGDPSDDHVALQLNGTEDHTDPNNGIALVSVGDIEDGLIHLMRLRIQPVGAGASYTFEFYLDDLTTPKITHSFTSSELAIIFPDPSNVIWGVTGANGGLTSTQKFGQANVCSTSAFPVEWTFFDGELQQDGSVQLMWGTAQEENNKGFEIERQAADGWNILGKVDGQGNSQEGYGYTFTDIIPKAGFNIYRIKQVDFDGQATYSSLVEIYLEPSNSLVRIFPNPAGDYFSLQLPSDQMEGNMTLAYFDLKGQQVYRQAVSVNLGEGYLKAKTPDLSTGIYMVELQKYRQRVMPPARLVLR